MDKHEVLKNYIRQQSELQEVIRQAECDIQTSLLSREYGHVEKSAGIANRAELALMELAEDILRLRTEIDEETREIL